MIANKTPIMSMILSASLRLPSFLKTIALLYAIELFDESSLRTTRWISLYLARYLFLKRVFTSL